MEAKSSEFVAKGSELYAHAGTISGIDFGWDPGYFTNI
jgi:hypothetical protein